MATITYQILSTVAVTPNWWGQITEGSSTASANTAYGFAPARDTPPAFFKGILGSTVQNGTQLSSSYTALSTGPIHGTGSTATGDSFVSTRQYTGTFATGNWTFNLNMRATTAGAVGRCRVRMWASTSIDASSTATRALSTSLVGATITLSTSADNNSSITWAV